MQTQLLDRVLQTVPVSATAWIVVPAKPGGPGRCGLRCQTRRSMAAKAASMWSSRQAEFHHQAPGADQLVALPGPSERPPAGSAWAGQNEGTPVRLAWRHNSLNRRITSNGGKDPATSRNLTTLRLL